MKNYSHHKLPILVIILVACLIGLAFSYLPYVSTGVPINEEEIVKVKPMPKPQITELAIAPTETPEQKKAAIMARIATVRSQPFYPEERKMILAAYKSLANILTEQEKQQIVAALNVH